MAATIQLPEALACRLEDLAKEEGTNLDTLLDRLLIEHLERRKQPAAARSAIGFKPIPKEATGEIRSLTGTEIDAIFADEDFLS